MIAEAATPEAPRRHKRPAPPVRAGVAGRAAAGLIAAVALALGLWIASHHPLGGLAACIAVAVAIGASFASPGLWLLALPALLPVLAFAPWTGWIGVEEVDLLVLGLAAGGWLRHALRPAAPPARAAPAAPGLFVLALFVIATGVSLARGVADAGGWHFAWTQGLREPLASLRLAKPLLALVLLGPLWRQAERAMPEAAAARLSVGLALGLVGASLAAMWERLGFTGLLNFSTDYRTTALFWEMQVGGAAFDGFLALTVPFALREWLAARGPLRWLLASGALLLALYACLTTFSRGVYLGIPVGLAVMVVLERARARRAGAASIRLRDGALALALLIAFVAAAAWLFPTGGYRGVLALWGAISLLLPLGPVLATMQRGERWAALALGTVAAGLVIAGSAVIPKGAYLLYVASTGATLAALAAWHLRPALHGLAGVAAAAGWIGTVAAVAMVGLHWGGSAGLQRALPAVAALLVGGALASLAAARSGRSAWPAGWRWQGTLLAALVLAGSGVGVLQGGAYLSDRFASAGEDLAGRRQHWSEGLDLLRGPANWAFGIGLGRFPAQFALAAPAGARPADYRFVADADGGHLTIASGTHVNGWGEIFRLSQRIAPPTGEVRASFEVRSAEAVTVHLEVCEKHLLYNGNCLVQEVSVPAAADGATRWRPFEATLSGGPPTRGPWYAPRLIEFSIALQTAGKRVEFDRIALTDGSGQPLLRNGDFSDGGTRWFFTSDRHHLPWHAKNLALHTLIEHGLVGLALLATLVTVAAWRTTFGRARDNPLAPPIAGALAGFLLVGLFDSLLDAARIALVFDLLLLVALTLAAPVSALRSERTPP